MAYAGSAGHVKTRPLLWSFRSDDKNRRDERWDQFADIGKMGARNDGCPNNLGTHCSHSLTTGYGPASPRAHQLLNNPVTMSEFYRFKDEQFAPRPVPVDPIGLAPKTVTLVTE
jgi:hypothetical protein